MLRRGRAIAEFAIALLTLGVTERRRRRKTTDDRPEWTSPWVVVGLVAGAGSGWVSDSTRTGATTRRQRWAFAAVLSVGQSVLFKDRPRSKREFRLGQLAGVVLYRLRYGVLGALPGDD